MNSLSMAAFTFIDCCRSHRVDFISVAVEVVIASSVYIFGTPCIHYDYSCIELRDIIETKAVSLAGLATVRQECALTERVARSFVISLYTFLRQFIIQIMNCFRMAIALTL